MGDNYNIIHLHSDLSSGTTNIDSVTKYDDYIKFAKENGMKAIAFTEHGNLYEWYKKKEACEKQGIKYIHAVEVYITESLTEKKRDNYHCCLYATNYNSFTEINKLVSNSFNREDGHFYFVPRITFDELFNTSSNIIVTTACIGGVFKSENDDLKARYINFLKSNKDRCYLELQHHQDLKQVDHNKMLYEIHKRDKIPMIVATDTHALNNRHSKGRNILQKSKGIFFKDEENWDITAKTYDELLSDMIKQNAIPKEDVLTAIKNTLVLADRVEEITIDKSYKYPKLYDDGLNVIKQKVNEGVLKRGVNKLPNYKEEYIPRIRYELDTYIHNGAIDFLLLDEDIKAWAREKGIYPGYSRGSCSGSEIAYLLGITDVDSIKHNMNFERFMNKERVSLADIDTDWEPRHREIVKEYIYNKHGLYCADIITFNTVALKGSIRDVCRALYDNEPIPRELQERMDSDEQGYGKLTDSTSDELKKLRKKYLDTSNYICSNVDDNEDKMRKEYPEVFEYVDIINGTVVSIGTHPCGTIVSPVPLDSSIGLCSIATCSHPVSMISMKSVDAQNFVKLDILGLDNIQLINETCKLANIDRLLPENVPDDIDVWNSMRDDNLMVFQWESDSAGKFLKTLLSDETISKIKEKNPNFKYMDLLSMGNGAIRPAGASYRDALSNGEFRDNGHEALNELLAPTMGYLVYQEQILEFLNKFCGYTMGRADVIRRGFAKKTGTEQFTPDIKKGFTKTMLDKYGVSEKESDVLIENFIQIIIDASSYLFSLNHSEPYSYIGYICAYLRHYYPVEFLTVALNISESNLEKTAKITEYANKIGVKIKSPKFRYSTGEYFFNKDTNTIYKGVGCIKNLNSSVGSELYKLKDNKYETFLDVLIDISNLSCNSKQLDILIRLDYFSEFGKSKKLLEIVDMYNLIYSKKQFKKDNLPLGISEGIFREYSLTETEKQFKDVDKVTLINKLIENTKNEDVPLKDKISSQIEYLGYIDYRQPDLDKKYVVVIEVDIKYTPVVNTYSLASGVSIKCKISKKIWKDLKVGDIIYIKSMEQKIGSKKVGEEVDKKGKMKPIFEKDFTKKEWWINQYSIIENLDAVLEELNEV